MIRASYQMNLKFDTLKRKTLHLELSHCPRRVLPFKKVLFILKVDNHSCQVADKLLKNLMIN